MKIPLLFILLIGFSFFLNGAGCTKIETPVRPESSGDQSISITPDGFEILDTEPLRLKSSGGEGTVSWSTEPPFEGCFQPAQGDLVLFTPPDVGEELFISSSISFCMALWWARVKLTLTISTPLSRSRASASLFSTIWGAVVK